MQLWSLVARECSSRCWVPRRLVKRIVAQTSNKSLAKLCHNISSPIKRR
jgi:hypothetical protein